MFYSYDENSMSFGNSGFILNSPFYKTVQYENVKMAFWRKKSAYNHEYG